MRITVLALVLVLVGCPPAKGSVTPPPAGDDAEPSSSPGSQPEPKDRTGAGAIDESQPMGGRSVAEVEEEMKGPIPQACAANDPCVPDPGFVKRFCNGTFPDVALVLMGKGAPFTHMFLKGDVDGWNAEGGTSVRARLLFDEEVLVLKRRTATNGIVVGSGASFLVMRWDGNCYTLDEGELTARRPPATKNGPIPWRRYTDRTRDALLQNAKVLAAYQRRGKECKGATTGEVTHACEQADTALATAVVSEVRGGLAIPTPDRRP